MRSSTRAGACRVFEVRGLELAALMGTAGAFEGNGEGAPEPTRASRRPAGAGRLRFVCESLISSRAVIPPVARPRPLVSRALGFRGAMGGRFRPDNTGRPVRLSRRGLPFDPPKRLPHSVDPTVGRLFRHRHTLKKRVCPPNDAGSDARGQRKIESGCSCRSARRGRLSPPGADQWMMPIQNKITAATTMTTIQPSTPMTGAHSRSTSTAP